MAHQYGISGKRHRTYRMVMNRRKFILRNGMLVPFVLAPRIAFPQVLLQGRKDVRFPASNTGDTTLVGWWKLNDASGTNATDSTGNGNAGTLTGSPAWGTGPNSNGDLTFDGTDDLITVANESNFDFERTNTFSITFWIKVNASASGGHFILGKNYSFGNVQGYNFAADTDNTQLKFALVDSSGNALIAATGGGSIIAGTWYFIAGTYSGSSAASGVKIYVNAGTPAVAPSGTLSNTLLHDEAVRIGVFAGLGQPFWGELDDIRIYNTELSSGQISTLNSAGAQ
jgi:hypothetical protein